MSDAYLPKIGTPYHPKELGRSDTGKPVIHSGLLGALAMVGAALLGLAAALIAVPVVLLGVAEYVSDGVTDWRVRWVRRGTGAGD